jgi:chloramphenicol O-acetyltransferase
MVKNWLGKNQGLTSSTMHNKASKVKSVIETIQNSIIDITNEIAKVQPRYAQSVSNFQAEYLEAIKKGIQSLTNFQGTFIEYSWINFDNRSAFYSEQIRNQVNTLAENFIKTCDIWNQITLNSIDISKENIKMYTQTITSMETHNRALISSWNSFLIPSYCK